LVGASEVVHSAPAGVRLRTLGGRFGLQRDLDGQRASIPVHGAASMLGVRPHAGARATTLPPSKGVRETNRENLGLSERVREADRENLGLVDALARANEALVAGDAARAVKLYGAVLELDPLCAEARMFAGIAHHLRGDPAAAVEELRAALFLDPDLWPAAFYLALNYEKLGLALDARREYQRVVSMSGRIPSLRSRSSVLGDIAVWKEEVVAVSKRRAGSVIEPAEAG